MCHSLLLEVPPDWSWHKFIATRHQASDEDLVCLGYIDEWFEYDQRWILGYLSYNPCHPTQTLTPETQAKLIQLIDWWDQSIHTTTDTL